MTLSISIDFEVWNPYELKQAKTSILHMSSSYIKIWIKDNKSETVSTIANLKKELNQLDAVIDKGTGTEVEAEKRMEVLAALR
ncbi:hypothetical protein Tco_1537573, partial [Tanacetum coccineum]